MRGAIGGGSYTGGGIPDTRAAFGAAGPEGLGLWGDIHSCDAFLVALDHVLRFRGPLMEIGEIARKVQAYYQAI